MANIESIGHGQTVYVSLRGKIERCAMLGYTMVRVHDYNNVYAHHWVYAVHLYLFSEHNKIYYYTDYGDDIFLNRQEIFNYLIKNKSKNPQWVYWNR